jgi:SAM-dependent methyltransferase
MRSIFATVMRWLFYCSSLGFVCKHPFIRHTMYKRLGELAHDFKFHTGDVLTISYSANLVDVLELENCTLAAANYPETSMFALPYESDSFDFVLSDQVLEHLEGNPEDAIRECCRVLRPGGYMVHTTCFQMGYHGPGDFWRFSPEGLRYICRDVGTVLEASGWGHPFVPLFTFARVDRIPVPLCWWHPLTLAAAVRRSSYDSVVWVVARKACP